MKHFKKLFAQTEQGIRCFYILSEKEIKNEKLIHNIFTAYGKWTCFEHLPTAQQYIEVGPKFSMETPESNIITDMLRSAGISGKLRIEQSFLYPIREKEMIWKRHDEMTYQIYPQGFDPLKVFTHPLNTEPAKPIMEFALFEKNGIQALKKIGMQNEDIDVFFPFFIEEKRVPTDVEIFQIINGNSEHSRHGFFGAMQNIDGRDQEQTLFDLIKAPYKKHPENISIAFHDNASAVKGGEVPVFKPQDPTHTSNFEKRQTLLDLTITAETHNFPTTVEPYQGATTGIGGMLRDKNAAGRGSAWNGVFSGYAVDNLDFSNGYTIPGDQKITNYPSSVAPGMAKYIRGILGVADYGNSAGVPNITGYSRQVSTIIDGRQLAYVKCILFAGGIGSIHVKNLQKGTAEAGMVIAQIGGPAYRVGFGGGFASSEIHDQNNQERDANAVQRGNPWMGNALKRVMESLASMEHNPIVIAHDQGAVGPCNAVTESIETIGGTIDIRKITVGDQSMSVEELWGAEYQERNSLVFRADDLETVTKICAREGIYLDVLGTVEDSGRIVVEDSLNPQHTAVNLSFEKLFSESAQARYTDKTQNYKGEKISINHSSFFPLLEIVMRQLGVTHKGHLVYRKDRTVGGKTIQAQCIGPFDYPISNYGLMSVDMDGTFGHGIALGEKPLMTVLNPRAGARMSLAEAIFNAAGMVYDNAHSVVNWMWPAKRPGQNAAIYEACSAISEASLVVGIPPIGGKDSLSMITKDSNGEEIYSPNTVVVSLSGRVLDINKRVTPLLQFPGTSRIAILDFSQGKARIGGSALAQGLGNIGQPEDCPDISPETLKYAKDLLMDLVDTQLISALHDTIGDGGLAVTLLEMVAASHVGLDVQIQHENLVEYLFAEEARVVVEYLPEHEKLIREMCDNSFVDFIDIGTTTKEPVLHISNNEESILSMNASKARMLHTMTNAELTRESLMNKNGDLELADQEQRALEAEHMPKKYSLSYTPQLLPQKIRSENTHKVLIIRDQGSNGDIEMAHMFELAGFTTTDLAMDDLFNESVDFTQYAGMIFVGGFSSKDVIASGIGWASNIRENDQIRTSFQSFFDRKDTFVLGVCNGCQVMSYLTDMFMDMPLGSISLEHNQSGMFESRTSRVRIEDNPSILFSGMAESVLSITSAHGEGRFKFSETFANYMKEHKLVPIRYVDYDHNVTEAYPHNPNGSPEGVAGITSADGRFTMMMPHPERSVQLFHLQDRGEYPTDMQVGPWLEMANNAYRWLQSLS